MPPHGRGLRGRRVGGVAKFAARGHGAEEVAGRESRAGGECCLYWQGGVGDHVRRHGGPRR